MSASIKAEAMRHLEHLCVEIGPRPIGSAGNLRASQYIQQAFQDAGLEVEEQSFDCPAWEHQDTCLEADGTRLEAWANAFSLPCDVVAPTIAIGTLAELEGADLKDRIAVLTGELVQEALLPKGFRLYTIERDQRIIALLEAKGPAALITVNLRPPSRERLIEDGDFDIPSATVPAEVGLRLVQAAGQTVHLRIAAQRSRGYSANVIGRKAGSRPERIVLCAHYDTKIETPGAVDNASGTAALLTLARILASKPLAVGLECVAFSAEEYLDACDTDYIRCNGDGLATILAAINMDGIGQRLGADTIAIMANSEAFHGEVERLVKAHPALAWTDPWPQSNHSTFAWRGVPSLAFTSKGVMTVMHQPDDTLRWISADKLSSVIAVVGEIVEAIQHRPLDWTRESQSA